MILNQHDFAEPTRIRDIALFLKNALNISDGSSIVFLLNDKDSSSNLESIEKWTRKRVWSLLSSAELVDLDLLIDELKDQLSCAYSATN
ncbi:MAG: hypothetical protein C9356_02775 [Oleiphilus sp.]|nr:MAG: hypothetical protein C9356_02775 [Oleiphilus sp.]